MICMSLPCTSQLKYEDSAIDFKTLKYVVEYVLDEKRKCLSRKSIRSKFSVHQNYFELSNNISRGDIKKWNHIS